MGNRRVGVRDSVDGKLDPEQCLIVCITSSLLFDILLARAGAFCTLLNIQQKAKRQNIYTSDGKSR